jgi:hypothetical protein
VSAGAIGQRRCVCDTVFFGPSTERLLVEVLNGKQQVIATLPAFGARQAHHPYVPPGPAGRSAILHPSARFVRQGASTWVI